MRGFGVDVVLVEPGLIRTSFSEAALATMGAPGPAGPESGPYGAFHEAAARATKEAYEKGPLAKLGGDADAVAKVIEKAIAARRPKTRYTVTPSAKLLLAQRALLSDRAWDAFLRTSFPTPGEGAA